MEPWHTGKLKILFLFSVVLDVSLSAKFKIAHRDVVAVFIQYFVNLNLMPAFNLVAVLSVYTAVQLTAYVHGDNIINDHK